MYICLCISNEFSPRKNDTMGFEGKWMQLEDIMLSEVSQIQKDKATRFLSYVEDRSKRETYTQNQTWSYTNVYVEHVCNSGNTVWNSEKEGKEKGMTERQQYCHTSHLWR
jgi:hypothetical protein